MLPMLLILVALSALFIGASLTAWRLETWLLARRHSAANWTGPEVLPRGMPRRKALHYDYDWLILIPRYTRAGVYSCPCWRTDAVTDGEAADIILAHAAGWTEVRATVEERRAVV